MLSWQIPAKTFLLGEYIALAGLPAILLTTSPCFSLKLSTDQQLNGIHPDSPAGQFWLSQALSEHYGLDWQDPYQGMGGLGASSAQFLGACLARNHLLDQGFDPKDLLTQYWQFAWSGEGLKPSGYDVLAQAAGGGCVAIENYQTKVYGWPFQHLDFTLIHTHHKLATHTHLQQTRLPDSLDQLASLAAQGQQAFSQQDAELLIQAVRGYHQALANQNLVCENSLRLVEQWSAHPAVLAAKGCGAMGADKLLLLHQRQDRDDLHSTLRSQNYPIVAGSSDLWY